MGVLVGVGIGVGVAVDVVVGVGMGVGVAEDVVAGVGMGVAMGVGMGVAVDVGIEGGVAVGVDLPVGSAPAQAASSNAVPKATVRGQLKDMRIHGLYRIETGSQGHPHSPPKAGRTAERKRPSLAQVLYMVLCVTEIRGGSSSTYLKSSKSFCGRVTRW